MGGLSDDERQPLGGGKAAHGCGPSLVRVIVIESVIYLLWAILEVVNVILKVLELMYRPFDACAGLLAPNDSPKHVVIVGASFGGLAAQRELAGRRDVKVTLIDFKSYFEYTPGVRPPHARSPAPSSRLLPYPPLRSQRLPRTGAPLLREAVLPPRAHLQAAVLAQQGRRAPLPPSQLCLLIKRIASLRTARSCSSEP